MSNTQKPEPRAKGNGDSLDFHSMFYTLQGEGPFAGHRAIFIRLAGCNLQCPGCDTEYTNGRQEVSVDWLLQQVAIQLGEHHKSGPLPLIVMTGGEPLRQTIGPFIKRLYERGFNIQIESNGVFAPDEELDRLLVNNVRHHVTLVVSPKTKRINERTSMLASAFKYVLSHDSVDPNDGLPVMALEHPASTGVARPSTVTNVPVYLNPYDVKDDEVNLANLRAVALSCMRYGYIAGVQMHKLIGLE
jgi:7-carboxy-7-deazaguanine synthase